MRYFKKTIVAILAVVVVTITFYNQYSSLKKDIKSTAEAKEALISRYIDLSKGFIDMMAIYSSDYFRHSISKDADLYSLLTYNSEFNTYNLDAIAGTGAQKNAGNLTGMGTIPDSGVYRDEMNMALELNRHFASVYNKIPDIAWVYYTSRNNFINIYPWVSSNEFSFKEDLKAEKFFTYAAPENNPLRDSVWTPVYVDHAGKGLMVTLSSPVYNGDAFMGAVSIDITNHLLNQMIKSDYNIYLVDESDSVIANSMNIKFDRDVPKLEVLLDTTPEIIEEMKKINEGTVQRKGWYYIYSVALRDAPWRMLVRVPVLAIAGKAAVFTLPVFLCCILLLIMVFEVEKRRRTEDQLRTSVEKLTELHALLDNAAKYDLLTSTVNRRGLEEIFEKNTVQHSKSGIPVEIIIADIDFFKDINDTYGHAAGDKVLSELARKMKESKLSENDIVCRWGGEEFVIVLVNKTYEEAKQFSENLRKEIESTSILWDSIPIRATMTFGVAEYNEGEDLGKTISRADTALYAGKRRGRNQVVGYMDVRQTDVFI